MADEWSGRTIDGRYAVESLLGQGGMGVVLRARHKFTGAEVALKMLHSALHMDPALESRFLAEARASNQIGHPAIVQVLDAGRTPEGELYLVMELLVGEPLRDTLKRRLAPAEIKRIALGLLDALDAAHARGFVHRDLKPENVFLAAPNASVKLLDFGIAKGVSSASIGLPRTRAGVLLGTLAYMAPEQLRDASTVDPRADLWALGVLVYEMISGRLPFEAMSIEELYGKLSRAEPDPIQRWVPTIAPAVEDFFRRALARDPNARFANATEMAAAVAQLPLEPVAIAPRDDHASDTMATGFATPVPIAPARATPLPPIAQTPYPPGPQPPIAQTPYPPTAAQPPIAQTPYPPTGPQPRLTPYPDTGPLPRQPYPETGSPQDSTAQVHRVPASRIIPILIVAVVAMAIFVIVLATRHKPEPQQVAVRDAAPIVIAIAVDADPPDAVVVDAAIATVHHHRDAGTDATRLAAIDAGTRDAGMAAIDAGTRDAGTRVATNGTPLDPYAGPAVDCAASCNFLGTCGLRSANCVAECQKNNGYNGCLATAKNDCDKFAACFLAPTCGPVGRGRASCNHTLNCQLECRGSRSCVCGCAVQSAPGNLSELVAYNTCTHACNNDKDCVARNCTVAYNRCKAQ